MTISSIVEFTNRVEDIESSEGYRRPLAWGIGKIDSGQLNYKSVLQVVFPHVNWNCNFGSYAIISNILGVLPTSNEVSVRINLEELKLMLEAFAPFIDEASNDTHQNVNILNILGKGRVVSEETSLSPETIQYLVEAAEFRLIAIYEDIICESAEVAYLKLMALSTGAVPIRSLNLNGVFGSLINVAWSGNTPYELGFLRENEAYLKLTAQYPVIDCVDKFPRYLSTIIPPDNTRILDTSKVRLGAQLAAGTVVMPGASYINFNAGTEGPVMVEGRISSSAIVGAGSDVGGNASILGTLSGGNATPITVGKNCLLEVNSVTGIPIGDECVITAGCEILAGTEVRITEREWAKIMLVNDSLEYNIETSCVEKSMLANYVAGDEFAHYYIVKGRFLSGLNGITIRRNSQLGYVECIRTTRFNKLNPDLH